MIGLIQWRARIGSWNGVSAATRSRLISVPTSSSQLTWSVNSSVIIRVIVLLLLLTCGDIELNPGPRTGGMYNMLFVFRTSSPSMNVYRAKQCSIGFCVIYNPN